MTREILLINVVPEGDVIAIFFINSGIFVPFKTRILAYQPAV